MISMYPNPPELSDTESLHIIITTEPTSCPTTNYIAEAAINLEAEVTLLSNDTTLTMKRRPI